MNGPIQQNKKTRRWLETILGVLALVLMGLIFARWSTERQDRWMREDLLSQTQMFAQTLHLDRLQKLHGDETDESRTEYLRLKKQLMAAVQINPDWRFVYLMGRQTNGSVFFQMDSEAVDSPDISPPGQIYEEVSDELLPVFDTGRAAVEGPVTDRWGVWVSAFVPLNDPETGELVSVLGIDIAANRWAQIRMRAMRIPLFSTLSLILLWLSGTFLLARRTRMSGRKTWFGRHLESLLVAITGITLTLTATSLSYQTEKHNQQISFRHLSNIESAPMADITQNLRDVALRGLVAFIENNAVLTAKEFRQYHVHLSSISEVRFWDWTEVVDADKRERFEGKTARRTGKADYQIWEKDEEGHPIAAGARDPTYPIVHLAPQNGNEFAWGFDLGSDPLRRAALETATQTGLATASDPLPLLQAPENGKGILVVQPAFRSGDRSRLQGFVAAGLEIDRWLGASRAGNLGRRPMAVLDLFQLQADQPPLWLGTTTQQKEAPAWSFGDLPRLSSIRPLLTFGKTYAIVARPTPDFFTLHRVITPGLVTMAGGVVTLAVAWALGLFIHRREHLAQLVDSQNRELATAMHHYDLLAKQNHIITWETDAGGLYVDISKTVEDAIGYTPKELIGEKHFYDLCPKDKIEKFKALGTALLAKGKALRELVYPVQTKTGQIIWISINGIPIRDDQGVLQGYWGTGTDITNRKKTEKTLIELAQAKQESIDRYRALISASNTGAWEYNDSTGVLWCSPEYFSMLGYGYTQSDLETESGQGDIEAFLLNLMHPDDRPRTRSKLTTYLKTPEGMYEQKFRLKHRDGYWVWIWSRGQVLRNADGTPTNMMVGTHIDITATMQAEDALRTSEQQYRMLTESMKDVVWTLDTQTRRFIYLSPSAEKLTGYTVEELMAHPLDAIMPENLQDELIHRLMDRAAQLRAGTLSPDTFFTSEIPFTHKDGAVIITELVTHYRLNQRTGKVEMHAVVRDITERKKAEAERERLTRAIEQSGETIVITDANGAILYVNPAFTRISGYSREETIGQNARMLQSGKHEPAFYEKMWKILSAGGTWEGQLINKRKDGTLFTEQASISPVRDEEGHVVYFVAVKRDITEQLHEQEEKEGLQSQLLQSQKMESIGRLAGGVAHDFNNMLQAILGYTEMAIEQVPEGETLHSDLKEIQKVAQRSAALTRQLQTFARKQATLPTPLQLNEAVEGMSSLLRRLIGEDVQLIWKPGKDLSLVRLDPSQIDQIVANLCVNARDAIEGSGQITIETKNVEVTDTHLSVHSEMKPGFYVLLSIRDNGAGMPPEVMKHLFEPFFTTKKVGKGTGLGLSTVYGIVKQNHGHIQVESTPDKGSAFHIYFPRHEGPMEERPAEETSEPTASGKETILLVEDEETILLTTRRMLESLGYRILSTVSPQEALELAEKHKGKINLVLTDVIMPGMNGPELIQQLLAHQPKLRHLFMSGYTANLIEEQGIQASHADFIQKPFSRKALAQKVRSRIDLKSSD